VQGKKYSLKPFIFSVRYLHIQLEKDNPNYEPNYDDALGYIAQLPFEAVGQTDAHNYTPTLPVWVPLTRK
jgi:hypothetical protein